jgi:hypothetical protein
VLSAEHPQPPVLCPHTPALFSITMLRTSASQIYADIMVNPSCWAVQVWISTGVFRKILNLSLQCLHSSSISNTSLHMPSPSLLKAIESHGM